MAQEIKKPSDLGSTKKVSNKIVVGVILVSVIIVAVLFLTLPKDKSETSNINVNALADKLGEPEVKGEVTTGTDDTPVNPTEGVEPEVLAELEAATAAEVAGAAEEVDLPEVPAPSENEVDEARSRDEQRLKDIEAIRSKLEDYKKSKGNYPETLDGLKGVPKDPSFTDLRGYTYTPIGKLPPLYYDLSFSTESESIEFNGVKLERGYHVSTPDASPLY
ncbi:MAG: hypothetical protein HYV34_04860 [Candidatus Kerfeldbacteria bacterium]|nr:hypothetical protein [Candidatus Kerfeldbacteria bacterium]